MAKTGRTCRNSRKKKCLKARATDFVVVSAQETETPAMKYRESLTLTEEGTELFVHAVLNPPPLVMQSAQQPGDIRNRSDADSPEIGKLLCTAIAQSLI